MTIEEKDFKLKPIDDNSPLFDVELLYVVKPRSGESRLEFKNVAYGCSLENAIKRIVHYRICCKHKDEAIKLKTYFDEYIDELNNLKHLLCVN